MAIEYQPRPRYASKNHEIIANLRESVGAQPPADPEVIIKRKTAELAAAMALLHGGDWRVRIDHQEGLVMVVRRGHRQTL